MHATDISGRPHPAHCPAQPAFVVQDEAAPSSPHPRSQALANARSWRTALAMLLCAGLVACAHQPFLPTDTSWLDEPRWVVLERLDDSSGEQGVLAVQRLADGSLRWSWFDWLGVPRSRQILSEEGWRNDGFLPPNPQARRLFQALMRAWAQPFPHENGHHVTRPHSLPQVDTPPDDVQLIEPGGGERWRVRTLPSAP